MRHVHSRGRCIDLTGVIKVAFVVIYFYFILNVNVQSRPFFKDKLMLALDGEVKLVASKLQSL